MICDLVQDGKRVGVTAVSHKVIRNLLEEVVPAARKEQAEVQCVEKVSELSDREMPEITEVRGNGDVLQALIGGSAQVAGGTAWLWSREKLKLVIRVLVWWSR